MKILKKSHKLTRFPRIVKAIDPDEEEFKALILRYPIKIKKALKTIFEDATPISVAAENNNVSKQLIRYYLQKMHKTKYGKPYRK